MRHARGGRFRAVGRGFAAAGAWMTAVAIGSACYAAEAGPDPYFILAFAVAMAATAAITWLVGGHRNRVVAFAIGIAATGMASIFLGLVVFWGLGEEVRIRLGASRQAYTAFWGDLLGLWPTPPVVVPGSNVRLIGHGEMFRTRLSDLARAAFGLAAVASLPLGLIAGGLMILSRRRPRLAGAGSLSLLLAVGALTPALMSASTALILDWRSEGGRWRAAGMTEGELAAMLGAVMGAVVGAILVGMDAWFVLEKPPSPAQPATASKTN